MADNAEATAGRRDDPARMAECDLVMKGGIASGAVYPRAIATLATRYRLRSIGGASAGAIAAAAAAAAEFGRASGGFTRLADLPDELAAPAPHRRGATRLLALFEAQPRTRALFNLLVAGLMPDRPHWGRAGLRWFGAALVNFPLAALVLGGAALLGVYVIAWRETAPIAWAALALAIVAAVVGFLFALAAWIVISALRRLPANGYGLCNGNGSEAALTPWLYRTLQALADLPHERPLTFGDLWRGDADGDAFEMDAALSATHRRRIDLRLMTTALSHGRPYTFPLDGHAFCFDADEWRALFPRDVVDHLMALPDAAVTSGPLAGKFRLGAMARLPVIVPVRMSLAFPLLLSAVPMYRVREDPDPRQRGAWLHVLEKIWFSDGGICSNFPIQLFDATLPSRPTFGIDLTDARFLPDHARDPDDYVWMPTRNGSGAATMVVDVERAKKPSVLGFLGAIVTTMQNWSDSTQLSAPGFRDRVVHVRLSADEGGLNLRMHAPLLRKIAARGEAAARTLIAHYANVDPPPGTVTGWRNQRWVRYRVAMRLLEQALEGLRVAEDETAITPAAIAALHANPPSYRFRSPAQDAAARAAYEDLLDLARRYADVRTELGFAIFEHDAGDGPRPRSELRIRPRL